MSEAIRHAWSRSRPFRVFLVLALLYALLRLAVHAVYLTTLLAPAPGDLPGWTGIEGPAVPVDLQVYLDGARHFLQHEDLYLTTLEQIEYHYPYPPSYALAFVPFLWLPAAAVSILHTLLHLFAYGLFYISWDRIFRRLGMTRAGDALAYTLPVWLVFSGFWADLGYLNIYFILALLATLLIEAILHERLGWAVLWLSLILQTKPQWAFAALLPLLLGRYRFFFRLMGLAALAYAAVVGVTVLAAGPDYGWAQYGAYARLLVRLQEQFPWRGPEAGFLGYNHSIKQIVVYLLGVSPATLRLATGVKALLLIPLAVVCLRQAFRPARRAGCQAPQLALDLAFALYLGAFIWLDIVWEVSLGIALFGYLLATAGRRWERVLAWVVFLPYALVDVAQVCGFLAFGFDAVLPGPYIITDPSIYLPLIMFVILAFYGLLIRRLWRERAPQPAYTGG